MSTFQLHIPEPCHEDWGKMTPREQGRFCDACQKCVVDLTAKRPAEILSLYQEHGGNMCGRVRVSQLAAPVAKQRPAIRPILNNAMRRLQRFALALLLAGGLLSLSTAKAHAQAKVGEVQVKMGKVAYVPTNVIEGSVRSSDGLVAGVTVRLLDDEGYELTTTVTDENGRYRFEGRWFGQVSVTAVYLGVYGEQSVQLGRGVVRQADLLLVERILMGDTIVVPEVVEPEPEIMGLIQEPIWPLPEPSEPEAVNPDLMPHEELTEPGQKIHIKAGGFRATIFPNPTRDKVFVTAAEAGDPELRVMLTDMGGRVLRLEDWRPGWEPVHVMDISQLAAGTYMLRLLDKEGGGEGTRIVKE